MALTEKDVRHVEELAHLELTEEEVKKFVPQLDSILEYMQKLNELDTSQVEPTSHVIPMVNVMREDEPRASLSPNDALANAPDRAEAFFRVPRIIED